jgi:hypothetical protein
MAFMVRACDGLQEGGAAAGRGAGRGGGGEEEEIIRLPCLVGGVAGPLLAARALPLRCAASTMLSSTLLAI